MAEQPFWQRLIAVVNREYERRVRAASLVGEYGADHHGQLDHAERAEHADDTDDGEVAVIANVPRGTPVAHSASPDSSSEPSP